MFYQTDDRSCVVMLNLVLFTLDISEKSEAGFDRRHKDKTSVECL